MRHLSSTRRLAVAGVVLAAVGAAGPAVGPAGAASTDLPDTHAAAAKVAPSALNVALRSTIDDPADQDWFKVQVPRTTRAVATLGSLPGDYSLAVYNGAGQRLGLSAYGGTHFERIIFSVAPGTYYVRVATQGYYAKTKPYQLNFRVLPAGVVTLDQRKGPSNGSSNAIATFYNNSSQWQWIGDVDYAWLDSSKRVLRRDTGGMLGSIWVLPPFSSRPFGWTGNAPPAGATGVSVKAIATPIHPHAALPAISVSGISRQYVPHKYRPATNYQGTASAGSKRVTGTVIVEHYNANGALIDWGYDVVTVGAGRTQRISVGVAGKPPHTYRAYAIADTGEPIPLQ